MTRYRAITGSVLGLASIVAILVIAQSTDQLPRALATLVVVAGPGLAWVPLLRLRDRALEAMLCVLFSVTAVILVAQIVTYAKEFSWRPCEFALLATTVAGLMVQAARAFAGNARGKQ